MAAQLESSKLIQGSNLACPMRLPPSYVPHVIPELAVLRALDWFQVQQAHLFPHETSPGKRAL